nr:MAG TPA: hypothetical protein [Caudoviricetes sp.]
MGCFLAKQFNEHARGSGVTTCGGFMQACDHSHLVINVIAVHIPAQQLIRCAFVGDRQRQVVVCGLFQAALSAAGCSAGNAALLCNLSEFIRGSFGIRNKIFFIRHCHHPPEKMI